MFKFVILIFTTIFAKLKKIFIALTVISAIVLLFVSMMQRNKIDLNNNTLIEKNREMIYTSIGYYENDDSNFGKLSLITYRTLLCGFIGEACTDNPKDGDTNYQNSFVGGMTNLISIPYANPPASSIAWLQNGLEHAGFIPKTYAAEGIGFSSIKGYITIWKLFRDLAFMLLVLFMVVLGFLIMFRVKLDGQTAVAIENALPRIVVTMLLITFSFAIVGFLIDLMYSVIIIGTSILFKLEPLTRGLSDTDVLKLQQSYLVATGDKLWPDAITVNPLFTGKSYFAVGQSLFNVLPNTLRATLYPLITITFGFGLTQLLVHKLDMVALHPLKGIGLQAASFGVQIGNLPAGVSATINIILLLILTPYLPGVFIGIVVLLTVILFMFRLFFILLTSYIKLIIYLIFAPFIIMFNMFPGNNAFIWWLKNILGELAAFPTVILISLTGQAIMNLNVSSNADFRLPFLYGFDVTSFNMLVALGITLLTPDFIKIIKKTLGAEEAPFNLGIGTFLTGASVFTGMFSAGQGLLNLKHSLAGRQLTGEEKGIFDYIGLGSFAKQIRGVAPKLGGKP